MTGQPPPYPRVPHLVPGRGTADDVVLDHRAGDALLALDVVVEEKLDGANVVLWNDGGVVHAALRSGVGAMDRAKQLGPLRAWIAERHDRLAAALGPVTALYAEWLLVRHTVAYDRLDSYLVALDVLEADGSFASTACRHGVAVACGIPVPPVVHRGPVPKGLKGLDGLLHRSAYGDEMMEGVVIRAPQGAEPRLAKHVRPGFTPIDAAAWKAGRPRNRLREAALSWR